MGRYRLPVSPPAASDQRCVVGRTDDDGRCFNFEGEHFDGSILTLLMLLRRSLTESGSSKLIFGDENLGSIFGWTRHSGAPTTFPS